MARKRIRKTNKVLLPPTNSEKKGWHFHINTTAAIVTIMGGLLAIWQIFFPDIFKKKVEFKSPKIECTDFVLVSLKPTEPVKIHYTVLNLGNSVVNLKRGKFFYVVTNQELKSRIPDPQTIITQETIKSIRGNGSAFLSNSFKTDIQPGEPELFNAGKLFLYFSGELTYEDDDTKKLHIYSFFVKISPAAGHYSYIESLNR